MEDTRILGEGKISKLLLKFSVPCIASMLIGAFYNIVDQMFIGNSSLGYLGNAATGISFPILCIANAFAWCIGDGAASYLSICAGRDDKESAHKSVGTGIVATTIISIALAIICYIYKEPLMRLFGASDLTIDLAVDYFGIIAAFFPPYLLFNVMNSMIRADGNPTYAMIAIIVGCLINIVLDPLFIFVFDWGIKGAAYATIIGQVISFILCSIYFFKPKTFKLTKESFKIDHAILKTLINLGGSTFIAQIGIVVVSLLSNIILFKYGNLSIYGSDIPISVFSIQTKVYTIVNGFVVGVALGAQPILGYNFGANNMQRVKDTYKAMLYASLGIGLIATLIFEFYPTLIINCFGSATDLYLQYAILTFRIYLSTTIITCIIKLSSIFFQAIGKPVEAMVASVIRDIICFVIFTIFLSALFENYAPGNGVYGILFSAPLADLVALVVIVVMTNKFFKSLNYEKTDVKPKNAIIQPSKPGVIITIQREHGSRGKQIGKLVAEELGIPFYYKEMMDLAAEESGLDQDFITDLNTNANETFPQLYLSSEAIRQAVLAQAKVIRKIAEQGSCVIVGRAADYILRDNPNVCSLFLSGNPEQRVQNIMKMYGDTYEEAQVYMHKSDEARANYYANLSGRDWHDISNYDLCLDTGIGDQKTVEIIVDYVKNKNN